MSGCMVPTEGQWILQRRSGCCRMGLVHGTGAEEHFGSWHTYRRFQKLLAVSWQTYRFIKEFFWSRNFHFFKKYNSLKISLSLEFVNSLKYECCVGT